MKEGRRRALGLGLAVVVALVAGGIAYAVTAAVRSSPSPVGAVVHGPLKAGTAAPPIDLSSLSGHGRVRLASLRGMPVVVNFFASWCTDCRAELHAFAEAAATEAGRARFLGVDSDDGQPGEARSLLRQAGATYPVGVDPNGDVQSTYDIPGLPTTFVLDKHGRVVVELVGELTFGDLEHWIARAGRTSGA
ncbi:MAG: TlpA family protein disulfide reductase [Acidimicrobiales bacterium]